MLICKILGEFKQYDHGPKENMRIYGVEIPPAYNLSNVRTQIHIIYGGNDRIIFPAVSILTC